MKSENVLLKIPFQTDFNYSITIKIRQNLMSIETYPKVFKIYLKELKAFDLILNSLFSNALIIEVQFK